MSLWRLYYHIVWATKQRQNLIKPEHEIEIYDYIIGKSSALNSIIHGIGGTENHIHLIASIPPTLAISEFVKKIKGSSSRYINQDLNPNSIKFSWQEGYGIFSLGSKQLNQALAYVKNQKQHHAQGTINVHLEKVTFSN
ncbi:MAG: IS200/IS605 family transposase [Rivularia sp. (in: cyanobacteria)]